MTVATPVIETRGQFLSTSLRTCRALFGVGGRNWLAMLVFMVSLASCGPGTPVVVGGADSAVPEDGGGVPIVIRASQTPESDGTAPAVTPRLGDVDLPPTPRHTPSPTTPVLTAAPTRGPEHRDDDYSPTVRRRLPVYRSVTPACHGRIKTISRGRPTGPQLSSPEDLAYLR